MKKFLFALPMLAIAFAFTYCDRSNLQEELSGINPNAGANDRATCNVQFDKASPTEVTICGTNLNTTNCSSCTGDKNQGVTPFAAGSSQMFLTLTTPIELSLTSATGNTVTITTTAGQVVANIPGGGCVKVRIDASCSPTVI